MLDIIVIITSLNSSQSPVDKTTQGDNKKDNDVTRERPMNLDLTKISYPITAIVSILHRISGIIIFLLLPVFLYLLHDSLVSETSFTQLQTVVHHPVLKFIIWGGLSAVAFHFWAGIRHMLMDLGFGESLTGGRITAVVVIVLTILSILFLGAWLWQQ